LAKKRLLRLGAGFVVRGGIDPFGPKAFTFVLDMDTYLLRIYQQQAVFSRKAVLLGLQDIQSGVPDRPWYGVQNLIIGAGNLSKALWGAGSQQES